MQLKTLFILVLLLVICNNASAIPMMNSDNVETSNEVIKTEETPKENTTTTAPSKDENNDIKQENEINKIEPLIPMVQESFNQEDADVDTVKELIYSPRKIYKINIREAMSTTIILPPNEEIKKIVIGDEASFVAEQMDKNILMLFTQKVDRDSSLTVITKNKTVYPFYVKSIAFDSKILPDLVIRFKDFYNTQSFLSQSEQQSFSNTNNDDKEVKKDFVKEAPLNPSSVNWNYKMKGNKSIAPKRVWNDGYITYLDFGDKSKKLKDVVTAYLVKDGVDTHVNVNWESENILRVEAVGNLTLLNGKKHTCIEFLG